MKDYQKLNGRSIRLTTVSVNNLFTETILLVTSTNFWVVIVFFWITYCSLLSKAEPLNLVPFVSSKNVNHPVWITVNAFLHLVTVFLCVKILSGPVLSDSGKSFLEIRGWKILFFTITITTLIFKGESVKEAWY